MSSKSNQPLTDAELAQYEAGRDLAADLLQAVREMKAEKLHVVLSPVTEARKKTGLSQTQFATLMGVSVRTLQGWEQGRKQPSGAARTLLAIASTNPRRCWRWLGCLLEQVVGLNSMPSGCACMSPFAT